MSDHPPVFQAAQALHDLVVQAQILSHAFFEAGGENPSSMVCVWQSQMSAILAAADNVDIELRRHLGGEFA